MNALKKYNFKKIFINLLWVAIGVCALVLHLSASKKITEKKCKGIDIDISGVYNHYFIDTTDVRAIINDVVGSDVKKVPIASLNLQKIENEIRKDIWIKNVELFIDNNGILKVEIDEREPVTRIFTVEGRTFYIDSSLKMLPISDKFSARLPLFTGFPSEAIVLSKKDSSLLKDVRNLSMYIERDSFLMAMIDQVDITPNGFEFIPKLGDQVIVFGDGNDIDEKFNKLKLFYKDIMLKAGLNRYSVISLQYKNQVVAKIRGKEDIAADSLRTIELMKLIAENAEQNSADSLLHYVAENEKVVITSDSSIVSQSLQRDEEEAPANDFPVKTVTTEVITNAPAVKPATTNPVKPKPVVTNKKADPKKQVEKPAAKNAPPKAPKVIMPKQPTNDY